MILNADVGEYQSGNHYAFARDAELLPYIGAVNIACGGHAGDVRTMMATVAGALRYRVRIGAHPGYPDRQNFGRIEMTLDDETIAAIVATQVRGLQAVADGLGTAVAHVKPHGALYNQAAREPRIARAIALGVSRSCPGAILVGLAGSVMLEVFREAGFRTEAEAFADRRYAADGTLCPRHGPDADEALVTEPEAAAAQAADIAFRGRVIALDGSSVAVAAETICVHGDTPGAVEIAAAVKAALGR